MKQLKPSFIYKQRVFKANTELDGFPVLFGSGQDDKSKEWYVSVVDMHVDEMPEEVMFADDTAILTAELLNLYFTGMLFIENPNQTELFKQE